VQIVIPQLSKHVLRIDILRIVIKDTLHAGDMSYRAQRGAADFACPLGDRVGHREDLLTVLMARPARKSQSSE